MFICLLTSSTASTRPTLISLMVFVDVKHRERKNHSYSGLRSVSDCDVMIYRGANGEGRIRTTRLEIYHITIVTKSTLTILAHSGETGVYVLALF